MAEQELHAGLQVGRYVVLGRVGAGAMGVVYAAYDPELDRRVALKVLQPQRDGSPRGAERLLREAQAMARLAHPNVVTVHDVGSFGGQVFLAMEFIAGETLRSWLGRPHPVAEVLEVLRGAGRGLAAAHTAGLVHRDFKPENVLLGPGGRVLVVDFGLARAHAEPNPEPSGKAITLTEVDSADDAPLVSQFEASAAASGLAGTPAYMAPEQFLGGAVGPAADQFALAICHYEALFGVRPFAPERTDLPEMLALGLEVVHGRVRAPPKRASLPKRVHRALQRALSVDPADRFPTVEHFLQAVTPASSRRAWFAIAATLGVVGVALMTHVPPPCEEDPVALADTGWPARAREVRAAFASSGVNAWEARYSRLSTSLDRHVMAWSAMRKTACKATRVQGVQSEALLDLRMICLERARHELAAFIAVLVDADATLVEAAPAAALKLSVERCADLETLGNPTARPKEPARRAAAEALERELAELKALETAARYREAVPRARTATQAAARLEYPPLQAEALQVLASVLEGAGSDPKVLRRLTFDAALMARAGGAEVTEATAWINLLWVEATALKRPEPALVFRDLAEVALRRVHDPGLVSRLENYTGIAHRIQGDYREAAIHLERAVALAEGAGPARPIVESSALSNLSLVYVKQGRHEEAVECLKQAIALREGAVGPDHPDVGMLHLNLVASYDASGRYDDGLREARLSHDILERAHGPKHPRTLLALNNIGGALMAAGRFAEARAPVTLALARRREVLGDDHPDVARSRCDLGEVLLGLEDPRGALVELDQALAIWTSALGSEHDVLAVALTDQGRAELMLGRPGAAIPILERALRLRLEHRVDRAEVGSTQLLLAHALWASGAQLDRARWLLTAAQAELAASGAGRAAELAKAERLSAEMSRQRSRKSSSETSRRSSQR